MNKAASSGGSADSISAGVLSRIKTTGRIGHLTYDIIKRLFSYTPVELIAGYKIRVQIEATEERIIIQHLLKVRCQPMCIDGVAMEATTKLIIDATIGHVRQCLLDHLEYRSTVSGWCRIVLTTLLMQMHTQQKL